MKKINFKKTILLLGTLSVVSTPIIIVVSCGENHSLIKEKITFEKQKINNVYEWNDYLNDPENHFNPEFTSTAKKAIDWSDQNSPKINIKAFENQTIPNNFILPQITEVRNYAFYGAHLPSTFHLPKTVNFIGSWAFMNTNIPPNFTLPPLVTAIHAGSFQNTILPKSFALSKSVTLVDDVAFAGATIPKGFIIPSSVIKFGFEAFTRANIPSDFVIPKTVVTRWADTFKGVKNLKGELMVPQGLISIGNYAFQNSRIPLNFKIPPSITHILIRAFENAILPLNFTVPRTVVSIDRNAFIGATTTDGQPYVLKRS